jgi:hypothetical protein
VRLVGATVGDVGRDVCVGAVSSPPQAAAIRMAMAKASSSQRLASFIAYLH